MFKYRSCLYAEYIVNKTV